MSKDIHEVQMDVMEWMEITDLKEMIRQSKQTENERKIAMQADTLNAVVLALRCRGTHHGKRMKGIAQGLLQASQTYNCFTKQEQTKVNGVMNAQDKITRRTTQ